MICDFFLNILKQALIEVLKNGCLATTIKILGKIPVKEIIFSKVAGLQPATLLKK